MQGRADGGRLATWREERESAEELPLLRVLEALMMVSVLVSLLVADSSLLSAPC